MFSRSASLTERSAAILPGLRHCRWYQQEYSIILELQDLGPGKPQAIVVALGTTGTKMLTHFSSQQYENVSSWPLYFQGRQYTHPLTPPYLRMHSDDFHLEYVAQDGVTLSLAPTTTQAKQDFPMPDIVLIAARFTATRETTLNELAKFFQERGALVVVLLAGSLFIDQSIRCLANSNNPCPAADSTFVMVQSEFMRGQTGELTVAAAVEMDSEYLALSVSSMLDTLFKPGIINLDFADVAQAFSASGLGTVTIARAPIRETRTLVESIRSHPIWSARALGGYENILACVTGDRTLSLAGVTQVLSDLTPHLKENANVLFGVNISEEATETQLVLFAGNSTAKARVSSVAPDQVTSPVDDWVREESDSAGDPGSKIPPATEPTKPEAAFISYSRCDFHRIEPTLTQLQKAGFTLWYDDQSIVPAEDCFDEIASAIEACPVVLLFLSKAAASSQYVRKEISFALSRRKKILPILLEEFSLPAGLDLQIGTHQRLELFRNGPADFQQKLVDSLRRFLSGPGQSRGI